MELMNESYQPTHSPKQIPTHTPIIKHTACNFGLRHQAYYLRLKNTKAKDQTAYSHPSLYKSIEANLQFNFKSFFWKAHMKA